MPESGAVMPCVPDNESNRQAAAALLREGGVVAYPTDTLYGLGALAADAEAVERVFAIKGRPSERALPVLVASADQLDQLAAEVSPEAYALAARFWPGALTLVLRAHQSLPPHLTAAQGTVAVRAPDHPTPLALIAACGGPITGTSANLSGGPQPVTAEDVVRQLGGAVAMVLDGGACSGGVPSTVLDVTSLPARVVRSGAIAIDALRAVCPVTEEPLTASPPRETRHP